MTARRKRGVYRVQWKRGRPRAPWCLWRNGAVFATCSGKEEAVFLGRYYARFDYERRDTPTQLVIHGKDGRIQEERTYGKDPVRRRG